MTVTAMDVPELPLVMSAWPALGGTTFGAMRGGVVEPPVDGVVGPLLDGVVAEPLGDSAVRALDAADDGAARAVVEVAMLTSGVGLAEEGGLPPTAPATAAATVASSSALPRTTVARSAFR